MMRLMVRLSVRRRGTRRSGRRGKGRRRRDSWRVETVPERLVRRGGFLEREGRAPGERLDAHRTALDRADGAERWPEGIGVEDDLAVDLARREDALGERVRRLVGALDRPVLGHDQVRVDVREAARTLRAQPVQPDDAWMLVVVERTHQGGQE